MSFSHEYGFPREILEIIFINLDPKTFLRARRVCKVWCEVLDYLSEKKYWKLSCEKNTDIYKPIHEKGLLNWKNVYKNSCLWKKINKAMVSVQDVVVDENRVEHMFLNNDEELCITLNDKLLVKDASTFNDLKSIEGRYTMFIKTKYMAAILTDYKRLHIQSVDSKPSVIKTLDNVILFSVVNNKCVYLTSDKRLKECCWSTNEFTDPVTLARWYNSDNIISIHCHNDDIYVLSESGKYLIYKNNRLIQINTFTWDRGHCIINYQRFHLFRGKNLIYSNDSLLYIHLETGDKRDYFGISQITSILLHGNILILGTHYGKIHLYSIDKLEDLLYLQLDKPLMSHSLAVSQPIFGFEVFEEICGHKLLVRTRNRLISINFSHKQGCN